MRQVIVTGANGFVGSNIVSVLIQHGCFVYAVDQTFDNPVVEMWNTDQVRLIVSTCETLKPISADGLIHAAFITATPEKRHETPEANINANLQPLLEMTHYAATNHIRRSIFLSSTAVYRFTPPTLIEEIMPPRPLGTYAVAKTMMEHFIETLRIEYGRDVICARLGNIYGKHEFQRSSRPHLSIVGQMLDQALSTGKLMVQHPNETREWTYAEDVGQAIFALLTASDLDYSLYNVASGERKSNIEIARMIAQVVNGTEITVEPDSGQPRLMRQGTPNNTRLREDTGFDNWTPFDETTLQTMLTNLTRSKTYA